MRLKGLLGFGKGKRAELPFDLLFRRFRDVLESQNRAIEIITDMGEKLGGEFLFDTNYISVSYSKLFSAVLETISYFDSLTRGRYSELREVVKRLDAQITKIIFEAPGAPDRYVVPYRDIAWDMSRDVGGKNFALSEIANNIPVSVPDGLAITSQAYDAYIRHNGLGEKIALLGGTNQLPALRRLILEGEVPPEIASEMEAGIGELRSRGAEFFSLRSSAEDEDGEFSFAGQFETVLNVPADRSALELAYKKIVASLFSDKSVVYQKELGYGPGELKMAVACMAMVEASASGVMYTAGPSGEDDRLTVSSCWGLGAAVVEGAPADTLIIEKRTGAILEQSTAEKITQMKAARGGGTVDEELPPELRRIPSLTAAQARELAEAAAEIEKYFRRPQDIEWALDRKGKLYILQSRALRPAPDGRPSGEARLTVESRRIGLRNMGLVVCGGVGAGKVFLAKRIEDIENFPRGAVLVARNDSSAFIRVMPYASAIITDTGSVTSHMASLSREFRVPTLVNTGNATKILTAGREITLDIDSEVNIYDGIVRELVAVGGDKRRRMEELIEYRKKKYILKFVSALNLIDPSGDDFRPEKCKTYHDVLRFIHEKAVSELVENARYTKSMLKRHAVKLDLPVPAGIMVIDIGGGLRGKTEEERITPDEIVSAPLKAIIKGMVYPGVWRSDAVPLTVNDFISSMMRMSDIASDSGGNMGFNVAVVSAEYLNLSLRFGYHFNMLDCYCTENTRNNHIYFRFMGGATDIAKRTRRVELIASILREFGFTTSSKGDLIVARIANISKEETEEALDQLGRLIAYTRQLDAFLRDDLAASLYAKEFLDQNYDIQHR